MDPAELVEFEAISRHKAAEDLMALGESPVQQFYEGSVVLVTGSSGFLGKQLVEKLLRSTKICKLYLIVRRKKGKSVEERMNITLSDPLYDTLRKVQPEFKDRIVAIEGDIAEINLGISDEDRSTIIEEVDIIFHLAATVPLNATLTAATITNVRGTREMINLAKECQKLRSFIHFSTAYTHTTYSRCGGEILEQFYPIPIPPEVLIQVAESLDEERLTSIFNGLIKDWENNYGFTKALAEDIVRSNSKDLPISIVRPSIVICANREPYPGWIDTSSLRGPSGFVCGLITGVLHVILCKKEIKIDFVPVDYVSNAAIAAATVNKGLIYTVGTSARNHLQIGHFATILRTTVTEIISPKSLWYCFGLMTPYKWLYIIFTYLFHHIPAYIVDGICVMAGSKLRLSRIYATHDKLTAATCFYLNNEWTLTDKNTLDLYNSLSASDKIIYHCNVTTVDWVEQVKLWAIGLRKYVLKDGLKNTDAGLKKQFYFKIASCVITGLLLYLFWLLFSCFLF